MHDHSHNIVTELDRQQADRRTFRLSVIVSVALAAYALLLGG